MLQSPLAFTSYDPWSASGAFNVSVWSNGALYDSLTRESVDGTVEPGLATAWKQLDPTTLQLTLRSGVTFSDGSPVDAAAVKANLEYAKKVSPPSPNDAYILNIASETVDSPTSVTLKLTNPDPDLLLTFAQGGGFIVNPTALANAKALTSTPAGSGPYTLDTADTVANQRYVYVKRSGYWDSKTYPFPKIQVNIVASPTAALNAAKSGQASYVQSVQPTDDLGNLTRYKSNPSNFLGLYINDLAGKISKPLGDPRVRQAMNFAIDRDAINKAVNNGDGTVSSSLPFDPKNPDYNAAAGSYFSYNPSKAKQLLTEAGYPNGFTVKVLNNPGTDTLAQAIAGDERKVGINLDLSDHTTDLGTQFLSGKWPITVLNYTLQSPYRDLTFLLGAASPYNIQKYTYPPFVQALTDLGTATGDAAKTIYTNLQQQIVEQAWYVVPANVPAESAYDAKQIAIDGFPPGGTVPFLYAIHPTN
ncbi:MAG: ABC transporter substrate-binding protein [Jatrophihabitans sp.]|uniref:ABC transporter substrate-binding protein n=1 Tax=Jatrophihabitans sp. TaxID=1932789 RepID=UPI003F7DE6D2